MITSYWQELKNLLQSWLPWNASENHDVKQSNKETIDACILCHAEFGHWCCVACIATIPVGMKENQHREKCWDQCQDQNLIILKYVRMSVYNKCLSSFTNTYKNGAQALLALFSSFVADSHIWDANLKDMEKLTGLDLSNVGVLNA